MFHLNPKEEGHQRMLKPLRDYVVVQPEVRSLSNIIYVNNKEPFNQGTIVAVGPKVSDAKVGDFIRYGNGSYLDWPSHRFNDQDYQIIQEADICFIHENNQLGK